MGYLKLLLSFILILVFSGQSKSQNPGQGIYGNIDNVTINSANLDQSMSKVKLSNESTTSVKYFVDMSRTYFGPGWYPVIMKVGLGYKEGNGYKFFSGGYTFTADDFVSGMGTARKELTTVIDHAKLPTGSKIYILYENHKPNVPASGWIIEAYALRATIVAYDFVIGTPTPTPGPEAPIIGVPPAFSAPVVGSVPLYEYVSGNKRRLTTDFYSSFPGFTYNGILGYVFTSAIPGTVPLYRYTHPSNGNHYFTITLTTTSGYNYDGISGYVYGSPVSKAFPVYESYSSSLGSFHRYSIFPESFEGYRFEGVKFYILQNESPVFYPRTSLYRMYNTKTDDRMLVNNLVELAGNRDWINEGVMGQIYTNNSKPGTVALYRVQLTNGWHLFTLSWDEAHKGKYEGIVGYVNSSNELGHGPIWRYRNVNLPHLYTVNGNELGNGGNGWILEGNIGFLHK